MADEPFRILPDAEFYSLTVSERIAYLERAVEAQKRLTKHIAIGPGELPPEDPEKVTPS